MAAGGDVARLSGISSGLAGGRLGEVVSVREDGGGPSFVGARSTSAAVSAGTVLLAPGTSEVGITVQVRWALER